jgi:hypothetical protein
MSDNKTVAKKLLGLCRYLVRELASEEELSTEDIEKLPLQRFFEWFHANQYRLEQELPELREKLGFSEEDMAGVWELFENPFTVCGVLWPIWYQVVETGRNTIKNPLSAIDVAVTLVYDMGKPSERAVRINGTMRVHPGDQLTDGFICSMISHQGQAIAKLLWDNTVDKVHDTQAVATGGPPQGG